MNTKPIPIMIVLFASCMSCFVSVIQRVEFGVFTKRLCFTVICFAIIGIAVRVVLDRSFGIMEENTEETEGSEENEGQGEENTEEVPTENEQDE